jgi:hypothetical protein
LCRLQGAGVLSEIPGSGAHNCEAT